MRTRWAAEALAARDKLELVKLPPVLDIVEQPAATVFERPVVQAIKNLPEMDLIVFTRVLAERLVQLIPLIQGRGIKVVCDIDDDFRHAPPMLVGARKIDPKRNPRYNWKHYVKACQLADWVTCSTPPLQRYAPDHSTVVRNCVPLRYLGLRMRRPGVPIVGWSGAIAAHPGDLDVTHGGVVSACHEANVRFRVVGDEQGVQRALGFTTPLAGTGMLSHEQYAVELARLSVGIVPLVDSTYNRSKSAITPLSMSALGVPWVGSPQPEYELLYQELLRATESPPAALAGPRGREWKREVLRALRTPENEREESIAATREVIRQHHVIETQCENWLEVWQMVAAR